MRSYRPEQIIKKIEEVEILLSQGSSAGEAFRRIRVAEQTHCADGKNTAGLGLKR